MTDRIFVIGDVIHFGPWVVGTIRQDIPATVRDSFLSMVHGLPNEEQIDLAYREGYDDAVQEIAVSG